MKKWLKLYQLSRKLTTRAAKRFGSGHKVRLTMEILNPAWKPKKETCVANTTSTTSGKSTTAR